MILAAGLLVLLGLALFAGGVLTGTTAFYWACVAVCLVAAVFLYLARRRISRAEAAASPVASRPARTASTPPSVPTAAGARASGATTSTATTSTATTTTATTSAAPVASEPVVSTPEAAPAPQVPAPAAEPPAPREPAHLAPPATGAPHAGHGLGDPPIEDVEVTDLLLVVDLKDEVLVVDEHPRYHLAGCAHLRGRTTIPLPLDEARADGFTPCAGCAPDRTLAERERARKHANGK